MLAKLEHSELAIRVVEDGIRDQNPLADDARLEFMLVGSFSSKYYSFPRSAMIT